MQKKWQLMDAIAPLINEWWLIHATYDVGDEYGYKEVGNNTIKIVLKKGYFDNWLYKEHSTKSLNRMFNNIIKKVNAEVVNCPMVNELWWEDSLRLLYHHYPYSETNGSNSVLINWTGRIIAIQYNFCKDVSYIHSIDAINIPDYIVLNNKKKLQWEYYVEDYKKLEPMLATLFSNKKNNDTKGLL